MIRTRFAPSPTGYLHIGGARTALYSWAYARKHGGTFLLRIEDTDLERSTEASVKAILDGMNWLGLDYDEGPIHQMDRLARYKEVAEQLLDVGKAYRCYCTREELDRMREQQRLNGKKPRYDGRWRPENSKALGLVPPKDQLPVIRFRNPDDGDVTFDDLVKGPISIANGELDDVVILRADGVPTYNFGVVVDDLDMNITHVIRGDDHVNNTPRQINIMNAMGAVLPYFAHVPMILGADGERLSKRHGAVSVMQYAEDGFLPGALLNYLARLGWSHGNEEIFTVEQFVEWFDLEHVSRSPAQFDPDKLRWINHQHLRQCGDDDLAGAVRERLTKLGARLENGPPLTEVVGLLKDRSDTLNTLSDEAMMLFQDIDPPAELLAQHVTDAIRPVLTVLAAEMDGIFQWNEESISALVKATLERAKLKMPKLAIPVRVCVFGRTQTPDLVKVLALAGKDRVVGRLKQHAGQ